MQRAEETEAAARRCGDPECVAWAQVIASAGHLFAGEVEDSLPALVRSIAAFQRLQALWGLSVTLILAGHVSGLRGDAHRMVTLLSASEALRLSVGAAFVPFIGALCSADLASSREVLTEAEVTTAWEEGRSRSSQAVIAQALVELEAAILFA